MRPVVIPNAPPPGSYSEADQLAVPVYQGHNANLQERWALWTKQELVDQLSTLIDEWVTGGAPLTPQNTPDFSFDHYQATYNEYIDLLKAGGRSWGEARRALIGAIGQYCCYCGSPVFSHLHIEHLLPKSSFPDGIFGWTNFLLACATCNSAKSNLPNQGTVPGAPMSTANATAFITNQNGVNYLWPIYNWASLPRAPIYPFRFRLRWIVRQTFEDEVPADTIRDVLLPQYRTGTLPQDRGLYYLADGHAKLYFGVGIDTTGDLGEAAAAVIETASLNRIIRSANTSKSVDRRILNRTTAWFRARILREHLSYVLGRDDAALSDTVIAMARVTIQNTGFWPIWLQELGGSYIGLGGPSTQEFLRAIFPATSQIVWRLPL